MRIRRPFLEALESEAWDDLPGEAYLKGFLRSYAEYLGLDSRPILENYQRHKPASHASSTQLRKVETELVVPVRRSASGKRSFLVLGLILLAAVALGVWLSRSDLTDSASVSTSSVEDPASRPARNGADAQPGAPAMSEDRILAEPAADLDISEMSDPPASAGIGPARETPPGEILALIREGGSSVRVRADQATRLEILLDDRPAQSYQLQAGAVLNWMARLRAQLIVENPAAVKLWVDQQPVDLAGRHTLSLTSMVSERQE